MRVRFDTPLGFTVPTQLAFVPLVFAAPLAIVPIAVAVAFMIAMAPDIFAGRLRASRLLNAPSNSWFAIGPVAVFAIAQTHPQHAGPLLLIAALLAQFIVDWVASAVRFAITPEAGLASLYDSTWIYAIDAALAAPGLLAAQSVHKTPLAALAYEVARAELLSAAGSQLDPGLVDSLLERRERGSGSAAGHSRCTGAGQSRCSRCATAAA